MTRNTSINEDIINENDVIINIDMCIYCGNDDINDVM